MSHNRRSIVVPAMLSMLMAVADATTVSAQTAPVDRTVAAIRAQYDEIGRRIRQSEARKPDEVYGVGIVRSELVINKDGEPWRAVGFYRIVYTFWFHEGGEPAQGAFPKRLRKATVASRISSRKYYQEFFYDQAGALVFHFRRAEEDDKPVELRLYLDKGRAIRVIVDRSPRDVLTPDDAQLARDATAKGNELRRLFDSSTKAPVD